MRTNRIKIQPETFAGL